MSMWARIVTGSVIGLALWAAAGRAEAVVVDCGRGQKIIPKLKAKAVVVVKGACTENLLVTVDDVTITTDGVTPASLAAEAPDRPAISLEGAKRAVIDGLAVSGGTFGISARGGATLELRSCRVTGASNTGVLAAYGSTVEVDGCQITGNAGNGAGAVHASSLTVANTTVSDNGGVGIVATRSAYLRVGQDGDGTTVVKPVTVSGNGSTGISITESSAGNVLGTTVESNGGTGLFVGRGSSGQIGLGSNSLTGAVVVRNGSGHGLVVEGGSATIVHTTVSGHALTGILVGLGGNAWIGMFNGATGYGPVTVTGNGADGVHVVHAASAYIGGTTITNNGPGTSGFGGFGILVFQASVSLAGENLIQGNADTGIFVGAGAAHVGNATFGLGTTNRILGNGTVGPNRGGVFAFRNGSIILDGATTIGDNAGTAISAFESGVVEMRGSAAASVPAGGTTHGASVQFGSTLRVRDNASIISSAGDGIQASNLSAVVVRDATSVVQGNGPGAVGVRCFATGPLTVSAATLTGNLTAVTGTTGSHTGCNAFP